MNSPTKKLNGNIHRIREFELEKVSLGDEFDILQIVGEGWFGKILLVEHRTTDAEMVLKALPKPYVSLKDFYREFHYGLHLGSHRNIVTTFDVAFETAGFYVFTQEYAPLGDLTSNVSETGIGELHTKRVAKQIAAALDYMHTKEIVHRDIKLDNILIFKSDFSRVKLCDFGESRRDGTLVQRRNEWLPYSPPEVLSVHTDNTYKTDLSHDVWQFGVVVFVCLTGCLPWQKAAPDDPRYMRYVVWHSQTLSFGIQRAPKMFRLVSNRACKMFKRFLEPRPDRRPKNLIDLQKFNDDRWLTKGAEKDMMADEQDELCPSMYSFHSNPEEKNRLLATLAEYGIETTVDRTAKKARIRDWIQTSVIMEEDEEADDSGRTTPSSIEQRAPMPGHVSYIRAEEEEEKRIKSTIKDASHKHYDPRTGQLQQGPSAMGSVAEPNNFRSEPIKNQNNSFTNGNSQNKHNHIHPNNAQQNYSISQKNTVSNISESGEQTYVDGRLNFPIHTSTSNDKIEIRPPPREHRQKPKSQSFKYFSRKDRPTPSSSQDSGFNSTLNDGISKSNPTIKDSGYNSLDYDEMNTVTMSPVLVKRSPAKSSSGSLNVHNSTTSSKDPSPFGSDIGGDDLSWKGSTGFVNFSSQPNNSMKDTPYDRVVKKSIKMKR